MMLTIEDVRKAIEEARLKRDFIHELTPANQKFLERRNGTLEAVLKAIKNVNETI